MVFFFISAPTLRMSTLRASLAAKQLSPINKVYNFCLALSVISGTPLF